MNEGSLTANREWRIESIPGLAIYPRSVTEAEGTTYLLARGPQGKVLGVIGDTSGFEGAPAVAASQAKPRSPASCFLGPLTAGNAATLRGRLPWLRPQPLGLQRSAGCGDRLGSATPGHIRAIRADGSRTAPILAQQSMRENARTGRSPQQVMDDAMWGVFQEGWRGAWGADADHLKTTHDVDLCVQAGYTFFTIDPGDHVDEEAQAASDETIGRKMASLPWRELEDDRAAMEARYLGRTFEVEGRTVAFDGTSLARAAAKYGRAIAHTARMYRHLVAAQGGRPFELEVSVDETEAPTSPLEHLFVASELRRLGVHWVSLAPRYVGRFEKGVDYIGDLHELDSALAQHAAIARILGPYKLSLHSGSDKFSVYPIMARHAGACVHLKTAGTSYLEALRVVALADPPLFRRILDFARERYGEDRATYHVSAELGRVPVAAELSDDQLRIVLDQFDGREVLHVTFGSVVARFGAALHAVLADHEETYHALLEAHFVRHLAPLAGDS